MKMFRIGKYYVAQDDRGRTAPVVDTLAVQGQWGEPETFLRLAYVYAWTEGWPAFLPRPEDATLLWERPDPRFACWDCGDVLVAVNSHGSYAPVTAEAQPEVWRDAQSFLLKNAAGGIFWTDQCPNPDTEEAHYAAIVAERGRKVWEVPEHG